MTKVVWTRPGREAREALRRELARLREGGVLSPAIVVVPNEASAFHLRRALVERDTEEGPGLACVRFITLPRLAELLALPRVPAGFRRSPESALLQACFLALRGSSLLPPGQEEPGLGTAKAFLKCFREIRSAGEEGVKDQEVLAAYRRWRGLLEGRFFDREDEWEAALGSPLLGQQGTVFLYLPSPKGGSQGRLLDELAGSPGAVALLGLTGSSGDDPLKAWGRSLGSEPPPGSPPEPTVTISLVSEPDDEARSAAVWVEQEVAKGAAFGELAVLSWGDKSLLPLAAQALRQADAPSHGGERRTIADTPSGRALAGWASLVQGGLARESLFDWLSSGAVSWEGSPPDVPLWRRICLKHGLKRRPERWSSRLKQEESAEGLVRFLEALLPALHQEHKTWKELGESLEANWRRFLSPDPASEDDEEAREKISLALAEAELLDQFGEGPGRWGRGMLVDSILTITMAPRTMMGSGVFLGTPEEIEGLDFRSVFVLGMKEGAWPPPLGDDPVLPANKTEGSLSQARRSRADQERMWQTVLCLAPKATLSLARADRAKGAPAFPSPWLLAEASRQAGSEISAEDLLGHSPCSWLETIPSWEASLRSGRLATKSERLISEILARDTSAFPAERELIESRGASHITEFDGAAGTPESMPVFSASSLEKMAKCPLQWFFKDRLKLPDEPEREEDEAVSPLDRGTLIHAILASYLRMRRADGGRDREEAMREAARSELDRFEARGKAGPPALWKPWRKGAEEALIAFLAEEDAVLEDGSLEEPEWEFGARGKEFSLPLGEGAGLPVTGKIDRWAILAEGTPLVVDYKVGSPDNYGGKKTDPLDRGREIQLPLYALVLEERTGRTASSDSCYLGLNPSDWRWKPKSLKAGEIEWPAYREAFLANLRALHGLAASGITPADPGEPEKDGPAHCSRCPYDRCCPATRVEEAERKSGDPRLAEWKESLTRTLIPTEPKASASKAADLPETGPTLPSSGPDQEARKEILDSLDETILVEAGAGTGKTTSLVGRLVNLVEKGVPLDEMAAITFTRKAAGELKERVRREIGARLSKGESPRLKQALSDLDGAALDTIHGFCRRILARRPLAAGLPPGFSLVEGYEADRMREAWWGDTLDKLLADPDLEEAWEAAFRSGVGPSRLKSLALSLFSRWDRLREGQSFVGESLREALESLALNLPSLEELRTACRDQTDRLFEAIRMFIEAGSELLSGRSVPVRTYSRGKIGNKGAWTDIESWRSRNDSLRPIVEEATRLIALKKLEPILQRLISCVLSEARERTARGQVTFDDLLILARKALREDKDLREETRKRLKVLFVDEFQDTDLLQVEIIFLAGGADEEPPEDWKKTAVPPGRLFFVGDPKQSIYSFRGADISVYRSVKKWVGESGGRVLSLTTNYRSSKEVLSEVNGVFSRLPMGLDGVEALRWPDDLSDHPDGAAVHYFGQKEEQKAKEVRGKESDEVARLVLLAWQKGWRRRPKRGSPEPLRLRDMAILIPKRTILPSLMRSLEAKGIPYRVDSRTLLLATPEVRDLTTLLMAIEDPLDGASVVGALRSPLFGCSDRELAEFASGRPAPWDPRQAPEEEESRVAKALKLLGSLHKESRAWTAATAVTQVIERLQALEKAALQPRPRDRWRRVQLFAALARDSKEGLRAFLTRLKGMEAAGDDTPVSLVDEEDDDAVKITTIHASKGLEYPFVILAGLGSPSGGSDSVPFFWGEKGPEFRLKSGGPQTPGFAALAEAAKDAQSEEACRLLYVGATRARDHLAVSLFQKAGESQAMAAKIALAMGPQAPSLTPLASEEDRYEAPPVDSPVVVSLEDWSKRKEDMAAKGKGRLPMTPTRLLARLEKEEEEPEFEPESSGPKRAGSADLGRAVHGVLQVLSPESPEEGLDQLCAVQAAKEDQDPDEVLRLVRAAVQSPLFEEARKMSLHRETFVSAVVEGVLLEGYVDLLAWDASGRCLIVDYKTDSAWSDALVEERMKRHRLQGACYSLMIKANAPAFRPEAHFVFLRRGTDGARQVLDLAAAEEEVRQMLREVREESRV